MKKVTIIGKFAFALEHLYGHIIKTKIIAEEFCRKMGNDQAEKIRYSQQY